MQPTPPTDRGQQKQPPWRGQNPALYKRRVGVDQFEDTQKRVQNALNRSYQGTLLSDKELELIAQTVLLDLLSSLDPLARAIAARELLEFRRETLAGAQERALRAAKKRDEQAAPRSVNELLARDAISQLGDLG